MLSMKGPPDYSNGAESRGKQNALANSLIGSSTRVPMLKIEIQNVSIGNPR